MTPFDHTELKLVLVIHRDTTGTLVWVEKDKFKGWSGFSSAQRES